MAITQDDARALLDVDENVAPEALRRAYLRAVKRHKPEADPEGFKRVREAYELLEQPAYFRELVLVPQRDETRDEASVEPIASAAEPIDRLASFRERVANGNPGDEAAIWRDAVAEHPDSVEARWRLYWSYRTGKQAAAVALRAYLDGHTEFLARALASKRPAELPEQVWRDARASDDAVVRNALLAALTRAQRVDEACALLQELLARSQAERTVLPPPADTCIELITRLVRMAKLRRAARTLEDVRKWLETTGIERDWLMGHESMWLLTRELVAVGKNLPRPLRAAVAKAISSNSPKAAQDAAAELESDSADFIARTLRDDAPALSSLLNDTLQRAARRGRAVQPARTSRGTYGWLVPLILCFTAFARHVCNSSPTSPTTSIPTRTAPAASFSPLTGPNIEGISQEEASYIERTFNEELDERPRRLGNNLVDALRHLDCAASERLAQSFSVHLPTYASPKVFRAVEQLHAGLIRKCFRSNGAFDDWLGTYRTYDAGADHE